MCIFKAYFTLFLLESIDPTCQVQFLLIPAILLHHTTPFLCTSAGVLQYCLDGNTFHGSNINLHGHQGHLINFLCVAHRVLLGRNIFCVHRGTPGLHNLDARSKALKHISAALSESLLAFSVAEWPTVDGFFHCVGHMIYWCFNYRHILRQ